MGLYKTINLIIKEYSSLQAWIETTLRTNNEDEEKSLPEIMVIIPNLIKQRAVMPEFSINIALET